EGRFGGGERGGIERKAVHHNHKGRKVRGAGRSIQGVETRDREEEAVVEVDSGDSVSVGRPSRGRLIGGIPLEESECLAIKASSFPHRFATFELVHLLSRAANHVAERWPGSRLCVGDLSREGGGRLGRHRSHRSGRDADIGFYITGPEGPVHSCERFWDIGRNGRVRKRPELRLDEERTWELLRALSEDQTARVQQFIIARHVWSRLRAEAINRGVSMSEIEKIESLVSTDRRHRNHIHLRIACPPSDMPSCTDGPALRRRSRRAWRSAASSKFRMKKRVEARR
ncbi:MAG: penicillin-insensitive murein endopeptidase, partial [Sandaracinaceae bacterium]|nr:penicillin-insensitive murein endopeptidase [Sandaracinaceae bacterium]